MKPSARLISINPYDSTLAVRTGLADSLMPRKSADLSRYDGDVEHASHLRAFLLPVQKRGVGHSLMCLTLRCVVSALLLTVGLTLAIGAETSTGHIFGTTEIIAALLLASGTLTRPTAVAMTVLLTLQSMHLVGWLQAVTAVTALCSFTTAAAGPGRISIDLLIFLCTKNRKKTCISAKK